MKKQKQSKVMSKGQQVVSLAQRVVDFINLRDNDDDQKEVRSEDLMVLGFLVEEIIAQRWPRESQEGRPVDFTLTNLQTHNCSGYREMPRKMESEWEQHDVESVARHNFELACKELQSWLHLLDTTRNREASRKTLPTLRHARKNNFATQL